MMKKRLDIALFTTGMTSSRSQAENYVKLGVVKVNGVVVKKSSFLVGVNDNLIIISDRYVSRAALKLASITKQFNLDFINKTTLDVGSSTGGFTDYALRHGSTKVFAVDVGSNQLHSSLRQDGRIELHEKTDIRNVFLAKDFSDKLKHVLLPFVPDIILIDVSFISLTKVLNHIKELSNNKTKIIAMCKPQFEAGKNQTNKGIVKNSAMRRQILKVVEKWMSSNNFIIEQKADSNVAGFKGNVERFYQLSFC